MARNLMPRRHLFLLVATACATASLPASGAERIGNAAAVRGLVQLAAVTGIRQVGKKVASGEPIYLGDRVTTGPKGRLQIMLLDETVFTIGPKAAIVIDEFVYDPHTSKGKVAASVLKGTFRFVTGKVSKRDPSKMVVKLPVGSIGVRGTSVAGETDGLSATVVLLGPGPNTNTGERIGSIIVTGLGAAVTGAGVKIVRPGFATRINGINRPPTPPVRMDPVRLQSIIGQLNGPPPPPAPAAPAAVQPQNRPATPLPDQQAVLDGGGLIEQSGDRLAAGGDGEKVINQLQTITKNGQTEAFQNAQLLPLQGLDTTFEQLRSITSGTANFGSQTRPITGAGTGSYTISFSYNFGTQAAEGNVTITTVSGFSLIGTGSFPLIANPFASGTGPVTITENSINPSGALSGGIADITYKFRNSNNVVFGALDHQLTFTSTVSGSGNGTLVRQ